MQISVFGHVCIDHNTSEKASYIAPGGAPMFIEKIVRQIPDGHMTLVAPYGADFVSYVKNIPHYPLIPKGTTTLRYDNTSHAGVREQKVFHYIHAVSVPIDTNVKKIIHSSDIVMVAPLLPTVPVSYCTTIKTLMKTNALFVLIAQGYYRHISKDHRCTLREFTEAQDLIHVADILIVSKEDHPDMENFAQLWARTSSCMVIVTLGEKGAVAYKGNKRILLPTKKVPASKVVDSVGSGDIFSIGFAYWYRKTQNIRSSGMFANALSRQCLFYTPDAIRIDFQKLCKNLQKLFI